MARAVSQNQRPTGQAGGAQDDARPLYTGDKETYIREMFAGIAPDQVAASHAVFEKIKATLLELDGAGRNGKR